MTDQNYWSKSLEELYTQVKSSSQGLSAGEASLHIARYGKNLLKTRPQRTALMLFLSQFRSPIILILLFATGLSAALQDWPDAIIIFTIILGSAFLSFIQENNASSAAEKLRYQIAPRHVMRDGEQQSILAGDVVPGDIVLLSAGSLVPADGMCWKRRFL
jgi:Mg2+-importing ATPase